MITTVKIARSTECTHVHTYTHWIQLVQVQKLAMNLINVLHCQHCCTCPHASQNDISTNRWFIYNMIRMVVTSEPLMLCTLYMDCQRQGAFHNGLISKELLATIAKENKLLGMSTIGKHTLIVHRKLLLVNFVRKTKHNTASI